jgi:diguanylate cyclase (GGDEF)-like protein
VGYLSHLYLHLQWRATRDPLVGLPNRLALEQSVEQPIRRLAGQRDNLNQAAFLTIDVDHLSRVNHALGHRIGDRVLLAVGNRLAPLAGADTRVARLEGDKFAVFAYPVAGSTDGSARADAVRALFDEPLAVDGFSLLVSVSIGVSLCPMHATSLDALSRYADVALERAKDSPSRVAVFRADEEVASADDLTLLADLDRGLQAPGNAEIVAFYQPQVDMTTGQVVGAEALLRWPHPTRGMMSPEQVLRVAEYTPIMRKVSMSMIDQVLTQLAVWRPEGLVLRVSVNVSVRDLQSAEFIDWLRARLGHHGVDPSCLQLELTETALMSQPELVVDCLKAMREIGVATSLDDFGTGFSSLQHLRQLPLSEIKIERSFVQAIMARHEEESIIRAVVDLGRDLDLRVVAEGVEDDETKSRLLAAGCRIAQGYLYAKPMPAGDFAQWCDHRTGRR